MKTALTVVADKTAQQEQPTIAARIKALRAEANQLAREHVRSVIESADDVLRQIQEMKADKEAFSPAAVDAATRLADNLDRHAQILKDIAAKG